MTGSRSTAAVEWLTSAAPDPDACRWAWQRDPQGIVLLPAGKLWDVLIVPGALGRPTLDVLLRLVGRPGPVLAALRVRRTGFFVPPGTASGWAGAGARGCGPGAGIVVPRPGRAAGGVRWLAPPDGSGTLTDAGLLERAMHEAAGAAAGSARAPRQAARDAGRRRRPDG
ncbi:bifunctional DNA primase/polymerase [Streptomyces pratensis]|uniref:bifunctional DNA primase/polymerase n=1 Tax=Streptomyces pratensis TaxID=1169025 RepID=UPI00301B303D